MKLSDFETLQDAKAYSEAKGRMISPDMMLAFIATFEIGRAIENEDSEAAFAFRKALQFGSEFNLMINHSSNVIQLLSQIQAASQEFKDYVVNYANPVVFPFSDVTQSQFNMAKGVFKSLSVQYQQGQDICLTLNDDLSERVSATVWKTEQGFEPENAGRSVYLQLANKYRVDMSGKKSGVYEVRMPFDNADFTVELI